MNILMALSQLEITGAEVYATSIGEELNKRGHKVFYVSDTLSIPTKNRFFKLRFNKRNLPRRIWHIAYLVFLIRKYKIQLVHAHSRASSWSCYFACKITRIPLITSIHGRQPTHSSRKKFHALGDRALAVCENIKSQVVNDLNVPESLVYISRNGIDTEKYKPVSSQKDGNKPVITIIGRLTGPKGELCYKLLTECIDLEKNQVKVASGSVIPEQFQKLTDKVEFLGYIEDIPELIATSDLIIGAGRVAMESILMEKPTFAIGEAKKIGLVTQDNLLDAMHSNFGDIGNGILDIDFSETSKEIDKALSTNNNYKSLSELIKNNYSLSLIADQLEEHYQSVYVYKKQCEVPVIMYHRFIISDQEKGVHGTYTTAEMLEKHFKLINKMQLESLTFEDINNKGFIDRIQPGRKFIIITVDDGYVDNHSILLPMLKKYNLKAVIYIVTGENYNKWDVEVSDNPEKKFNLMSTEQIKELSDSGHVEIGGHTLTHPKLDTLSYEQQKTEIYENKKTLEQIIGKDIISFAYPYGIYNKDSIKIAKECGYKYAVATNQGPLALHEKPFEIRRIGIFPSTNTFGLWRKIKGNYTFRKHKK